MRFDTLLSQCQKRYFRLHVGDDFLKKHYFWDIAQLLLADSMKQTRFDTIRKIKRISENYNDMIMEGHSPKFK